jgi:DNA topoisomerase-1
VVKEDREGVERKYGYILLDNNGLKEETKVEMAGAEKSKLFPTDIGKVVTDFLVENFGDILEYSFTAQVEKEFDEIAAGQKEWSSMIDAFYTPFHETTVHTEKNAKKATGERLLGTDPASGRNVYSRLGRFGPMVQIGEAENEEKPKFASIPAGQRMEEVTLEQALELFKLPRDLGEFEEKPLTIGIGKYGPYVRHANTFVSIGEEDPMTIGREKAIEFLLEKREALKKMLINEFQDGDDVVQVKNGRYGPYISVGRKNYRIPKDTEPGSLTLEDCKILIEKDKDRPKRGGKRKKK